MQHLTGGDGVAAAPEPAGGVSEPPEVTAARLAGGCGWWSGDAVDYERGNALDLAQLFQFL